MSDDLNPKDLIERYLQTVVTHDTQNVSVFAAWLILQDAKLALAIAQTMAAHACDSVSTPSSGCCILADSGIPLGVLVAQALDQPMFFFRNRPWTIEDEPVPLNIYPRIPNGSTVLLVDSHVRTGFTSSTCHDMLEQRGVSVTGVVTAVDFRAVSGEELERREVPYVSLSDASSHKSTLLNLFNCNSWASIGRLIREATSRAREIRFPAKRSDETGYLPTKSSRLYAIVASLLLGRRGLRCNHVSEQLAEDLQHVFGSTESEIWKFFTYPDVVRKVSVVTGNAIDISSFDVIVGTGYLGTFLALCLAWHNEFTGSILSSASPIGWEQTTTHEGAKRYLICCARLTSGYYTLGALGLLSDYSIKPHMILILREASDQVGFPRNRALFSLDKLGIEIVAIS